MALNRTMNYVLKHGELTVDIANIASYSYVGGSPITIDSGGLISAYITTEVDYAGVAYHRLEEDNALEDQGTILFAPAIVTIEPETMNDGSTVKPWKTYGSLTWAIGDLLRPMNASGTPAYAVWTNEVYSAGSANEHNVFFAKVIGLTGTTSVPTSLTLLLGTFVKIRT